MFPYGCALIFAFIDDTNIERLCEISENWWLGTFTVSKLTVISTTHVTFPITGQHSKFSQLNILAYIKTSKIDTSLLGTAKESSTRFHQTRS